ncbi:MAG: Meiotic recombination protein dmc1 [Bathelium mastoideum]|nr:MAG: Meiotic recombination protein dmc1 [Bathelium mastoideum]
MVSQTVPTQVSDFTVLPVSTDPLPSFPNPTAHYLYIRPQDPNIPHPDAPRSLFVANTPIDATLLHFRGLWAHQLGGLRVERVDFEEESRKIIAEAAGKTSNQNEASKGKKSKKRKRGQLDPDEQIENEETRLPKPWDRELRKSGGSAVVVFVDRTSAEAAIRAVKRAAKMKQLLTWGHNLDGKIPRLGLERYRAHHKLSYPSAEDVQPKVDLYMTRFAAAEVARTKRLARLRQVPDEDGFITVTRGGRVGPARIEETHKMLEEQQERNKGKEDFYRFQVRERKKAEAGQLLKAFEEDKKKVVEMQRRKGGLKPMS